MPSQARSCLSDNADFRKGQSAMSMVLEPRIKTPEPVLDGRIFHYR
jgi:hypothetical protein